MKLKESLSIEKKDQSKLKYALSFLLYPSIVQTVSYGTRELKLYTLRSECLTILDVVRTVCHKGRATRRDPIVITLCLFVRLSPP